MFGKILIANRGEIACRVIRSARAMGVATVAVYSDADRNALHVTLADEAVYIGAAPSTESYLNGERIVRAAKSTGAQAVHPGYGFLSENADFCRLCGDEGIVFIGPPAVAIEAMGSKSAAKRIMQEAGVPLAPGYHGEDQADETLQRQAEEIGFPVLLKAVAGGGGKGMRVVLSAAEFDTALAAARRESQAAFGDQDMLVEKYLTRARHVEFQIFCDSDGGALHLFERDCSVQRRHQKIVEEAPAPGIGDALRRAMGEAAVRAAQAIGYRGAGTVEFLLADGGEFYFMEMNTRLQVEHPVTEMITGQDLVEWQLRVAAGEPLPLSQTDLAIDGHAFEARIYAEDPDNDFLPATGRLSHLQAPVESRHVRVDSGVVEGDDISVYYDPMIAKLIVWDESRERAAARLARALRDYQVGGVATNIEFLYNLVSSEPFRAADLDTGFIERHHDHLFHGTERDLEPYLPLAVLFLLLDREHSARARASGADRHSPWNDAGGWRLNAPHVHNEIVEMGGREYTLAVEALNAGDARHYRLDMGKRSVSIGGQLDRHRLYADVDGHRCRATVVPHAGRFSLFTPGGAVQFSVPAPDYGDARQGPAGDGLRAPMNGTVTKLLATPGERVAANDALLVMEAMKMEHVLRAPSGGAVAEYFCAPGDLVDGGAELLKFVPAEDA